LPSRSMGMRDDERWPYSVAALPKKADFGTVNDRL